MTLPNDDSLTNEIHGDETVPAWAHWTLRLAGIYNLLWGTWVVLRPYDLFDLTGIPRPSYVSIWQCVGMIVGVYGVGYLAASRAPLRHWPITLVGFLGKIFGPVGMLSMQWTMRPDDPGYLPWSWLIVNLFNDLIWLPFFAGILWLAVRQFAIPAADTLQPLSLHAAIHDCFDTRGRSLAELSRQQPVLLTFLRHSGCTFCREAMHDLADQRAQIEARGVQLAVVQMSSPAAAVNFAQRYGLSDIAIFSDPQARLYRAFQLPRGRFSQLFGKGVWWRGFTAAILNRHGVGKMEGDGFQMPGTFLLHQGKIVRSYRHQTAADRPDYAAVCSTNLAGSALREAN